MARAATRGMPGGAFADEGVHGRNELFGAVKRTDHGSTVQEKIYAHDRRLGGNRNPELAVANNTGDAGGTYPPSTIGTMSAIRVQPAPLNWESGQGPDKQGAKYRGEAAHG